VVKIEAEEEERACSIAKQDKNTFVLGNQSPMVRVFYEVYGFDSSIRAAFLDNNQAFFNGTALFLRVHGMDHLPIKVIIERPHQELPQNFRVATGLPPREVDENGFGSYYAANYDDLVDHPFQVSVMKRLRFFPKDIPHEMVLVGDVRSFDEDRLARDLAKLCTSQLDLFGGIAPFSSYLFIARFEEGGYGGLEHRNSSMLLSSPYSLPKKSEGEPDHHYRSFLGLCSHEYFHAWNIKRLKPKNFVTYDYDKESYTTMLWLFEGLTSYYDDLCVRRAQLISTTSYLEMMAKGYSRLMRNGGRKLQSVAESSFDAWIKFYRPNENSLNSGTSYYLKGSFIGLMLDLMIRTRREKSLDDVMRALYAAHGAGKGFIEEQFFRILEEIGGIDAQAIRSKYIYGTEELPLKDTFIPFGIDLNLSADEFYLDEKTKMSVYLGCKLRFDEQGRALIVSADKDGPATKAGLSPNDEILAINGIRLDSGNLVDLMGCLVIDVPVRIMYARKKMLANCSIVPSSLPLVSCRLVIRENIEELEKRRLSCWLNDPLEKI
jgi:predicted metalloprotease with PDZ domain